MTRIIREVSGIVDGGPFGIPYTVGSPYPGLSDKATITKIIEFEKTGQNAYVSWFMVFVNEEPYAEFNGALLAHVIL